MLLVEVIGIAYNNVLLARFNDLGAYLAAKPEVTSTALHYKAGNDVVEAQQPPPSRRACQETSQIWVHNIDQQETRGAIMYVFY